MRLILAILLFALPLHAAPQHKGAHREPPKIRGKSGKLYLVYPKAIPATPVPPGAKASAATKKSVSAVQAVPLWLAWEPNKTVGLEWERNAETNVVGYHVYVGSVSRVYHSLWNVGNVTNASVTITQGTNFFMATAYDTQGRESAYSPEVSFVQQESVRLRPFVARSFPLPPPSGVFVIQFKEELDKPWVLLATVTNRFLPLLATTPQFFRVGKAP